MMEPAAMIAATSLVGLCVVALALLRAWQGWLELKREEIDRHQQIGCFDSEVTKTDRGLLAANGGSAARIELADLKERIRKLEAIANGVEL